TDRTPCQNGNRRAGRGHGWRPLLSWEDEPDFGAAADRAGDLNPPAMALDDAFDDGQAEPEMVSRSRTRRVDAVESIQDTRQMLGWDAAPGVSNAHLEPGRIGLCADGDRAALRRVGKRVRDDVANCLLEERAVKPSRHLIPHCDIELHSGL